MTDWHSAYKDAKLLLNESDALKMPDKRLKPGMLFVPRGIEVTGDWVTWWGVHFRWVRPGKDLLPSFLSIAEAADPAPAILAYARQWGVLALCDHFLADGGALPCSHNHYPYGIMDDVRPCMPRPVKPVPRDPLVPITYSEPVSGWLYWSQKAKGILRAAAEINRGRPTADQLRSVPDELDEWLSLGQVRPRLIPKKHSWISNLDSVVTGPNLFGIIGVCLVDVIRAGRHDFAICTGCGKEYRPTRRPDPTRRHYCEHCREAGVPMVDASRDYRRRHR